MPMCAAFSKLSLFSASLPSSPEHVQWDEFDQAFSFWFVLLVGRKLSLCFPKGTELGVSCIYLSRVLWRELVDLAIPWSSEEGYATFFGGTFINIYFPSVRHWDSEGHWNSILKFSIWFVGEKVGRVDLVGGRVGGDNLENVMNATQRGSSQTSPPTCSVSVSWERSWGTWAKTGWPFGFPAGGEMVKEMTGVVLCDLLWQRSSWLKIMAWGQCSSWTSSFSWFSLSFQDARNFSNCFT